MKNKKLCIRISEDDLSAVHRKAEQAKLSFTEYVTRACLGKQIVVIDGLAEVIRQQKAIGKNLNQLTMLCNIGRVAAVDLSALVAEYAAVNEKLSEILERRR